MTTIGQKLDRQGDSAPWLAFDQGLRPGSRRTARPMESRLEASRAASALATQIDFVGSRASQSTHESLLEAGIRPSQGWQRIFDISMPTGADGNVTWESDALPILLKRLGSAAGADRLDFDSGGLEDAVEGLGELAGQVVQEKSRPLAPRGHLSRDGAGFLNHPSRMGLSGQPGDVNAAAAVGPENVGDGA